MARIKNLEEADFIAARHLYDIAVDPKESHDKIERKGRIFRPLEVVLRTHLKEACAQARSDPATKSAAVISKENEKRLRSLGYLH